MKKVLVLMLVLGLVSVANAITLEISVNGVVDPPDTQIEVCVGDVVTLDIHCSSGHSGSSADDQFFALVVDNGYGVITGGVVYIPPAPSLSAMYGQSALTDGIPGLEPGEDGPWGGIASAPGETAGSGIYVDDFVFECVALGDAVVRLITTQDFVSYVVQDTQVIHQVPEPASMLLLGLGGLLLRRRK